MRVNNNLIDLFLVACLEFFMSVCVSHCHHYGVISLDKAAVLNALDLEMVDIIVQSLSMWRDDPSVEAVVIRTDNEKAFCAGGDVKSIYYDVDAFRRGGGKGDLFADFFFKEYQMNAYMHDYPKPIISLVDGLCMGGGVGLSIHGRYRIVSDRSVIAMPETAIGLFPDVGVGHVFSKSPSLSGLFLGLTGYRMGAEDALYTGYATHAGSSDQVHRFYEAILRGEDFKRLLGEFATVSSRSFLEDNKSDIVKCLRYDSLQEIEAHLSDSVFGQKILETWGRMSPTSMALTFSHYYKSKECSLHDLLLMDYRLSQGCMLWGDFHEGIRALLIDKDKEPEWRPDAISDLDMNKINSYFSTIPKKGDLTFL